MCSLAVIIFKKTKVRFDTNKGQVERVYIQVIRYAYAKEGAVRVN